MLIGTLPFPLHSPSLSGVLPLDDEGKGVNWLNDLNMTLIMSLVGVYNFGFAFILTTLRRPSFTATSASFKGAVYTCYSFFSWPKMDLLVGLCLRQTKLLNTIHVCNESTILNKTKLYTKHNTKARKECYSMHTPCLQVII